MSTPINSDLLDAFLEDAADVLKEWERECLMLQVGEAVNYDPLLRAAHNLKGSSGMASLPLLHARLHRIEDTLVQFRDRNLKASEELRSALLEIESCLKNWIAQIKTNPQVEVDTENAESRLKAILTGKAPDTAPKATTPKHAPSIFDVRNEPRKADESLRVPAAKLDRLIQLVGEMSLHQAILTRASQEGTLGSAKVRNVIDLKSKLTQDLQDAALSLRMIPVEGLFQKIERLVRETAAQLNKQVRVERKGDDVALDKLIVEGMLEPLIHIARNAIDHGIESPDQRVATGKLPQGVIRLTAENNSTGVTLIFEDDGRGIDAEKVYKKAIAQGLSFAEQELTPAAKLNLIFLPGISTAENVTELSGRGVGMDVVADTVKRMAGQLELESIVSKGTKLKITLPTNLSIIDALVVKVNGNLYAVPNQDLDEVIDLREFTIAPINGGTEQAIDLRGHVVPVEEMGLFLSQDPKLSWIENRNLRPGEPKPGIVIHFHDERVALAVEAIVGQQQIFVRPLIGHLSPISFFSGSTILSDGEPSIILNLPEMARRYFSPN